VTKEEIKDDNAESSDEDDFSLKVLLAKKRAERLD